MVNFESLKAVEMYTKDGAEYERAKEEGHFSLKSLLTTALELIIGFFMKTLFKKPFLEKEIFDAWAKLQNLFQILLGIETGNPSNIMTGSMC